MSVKTAHSTALRHDSSSAKPAVVAIAILLVAGFAYRTLSSYYARPSESKLLPPGSLARLPLELGDWRGQDQPLVG